MVGLRQRRLKVDLEDRDRNPREIVLEMSKGSVKFEVYGEEIIEKKVRKSGNSGRIYLPPDWVGHNVKIVRID